MRRQLSSLGVSLVLAFTFAAAQAPADMERHVAAAKAAAGNDHVGLFDRTCAQAREFAAARAAAPASGARAGGARAGGAGRGAGPPARDTWHAEPAKVFDNLYYVGEIEVLGLGRDDIGRHHPHRRDLRLLRRRRSRRRPEEAGPRPGPDQIRRREPRPRRPRGGAPSSCRSASARASCCRRPTTIAGRAAPAVASPSATSWPPTATS